jgi:hypothetical protein
MSLTGTKEKIGIRDGFLFKRSVGISNSSDRGHDGDGIKIKSRGEVKGKEK